MYLSLSVRGVYFDIKRGWERWGGGEPGRGGGLNFLGGIQFRWVDNKIASPPSGYVNFQIKNFWPIFLFFPLFSDSWRGATRQFPPPTPHPPLRVCCHDKGSFLDWIRIPIKADFRSIFNMIWIRSTGFFVSQTLWREGHTMAGMNVTNYQK